MGRDEGDGPFVPIAGLGSIFQLSWDWVVGPSPMTLTAKRPIVEADCESTPTAVSQ